MNTKERKEMNTLKKEFSHRVETLYDMFRLKVVEAIEKEEEKAERLEEHFPGSSQQEQIEEDIENLEDTLSIFEEAVSMITEVDDV